MVSGKRSFAFVQSVLENHVENIKNIAGAERPSVYVERLERLKQYAAVLQEVRDANLTLPVDIV